MSYKFNPFTGKLDDVSANTVTPGVIDNAIVRANGTGDNAIQGSDLVIDDATTATQANVAITNQHAGQTNSALVLTPKGTGALIAGPKPDGTAVGGNARGTNSVDLQRSRSVATQVASGVQSTISGGFQNTASATNSVVSGGNLNIASGNTSTISGGNVNVATGSQSTISGGFQNTASGGVSVVSGGSSNTASGNNSTISGGVQNTASGVQSTISGGSYGLADRYGMRAYATGLFAALGDAQHGIFVLRCKTTTNTAVEMALDGGTTYLTIPSGKYLTGTIKIAGIKSDGSATASYIRQFSIKNVAGTTTLVGTVNTIGIDTASLTAISITANDTSDYLSVQVTGILSETWRWVATVDVVEVAYGT